MDHRVLGVAPSDAVQPLQHIDEPEGIPLDTVVLVHGFPDSPALWAATVTHLVRNQYRVAYCVTWVRIESSEDPECTFDVVERLYATLVFTGSVGKTLWVMIGHDFLYMLLHRPPKAARRFGFGGSGACSVLLIAFVLAYQGS